MNSPTLIDQLERRFGHWAIPGLLRAVASFQAICFVLIHLKPGFSELLMLTPEAWTQWEVWRFFTFCFIPTTSSLVWIIFAIMILLIIGDQLEAEWGKFRLNLYFFATVACLWAGVILGGPLGGVIVGAMAGSLLYSSLFFAFATVVPDREFMMFFIIPVKARWLALLNAAWLFYAVFVDRHLQIVPIALRLPILAAFIPYACYALPIALRRGRHKTRVAARRSVYQSHSIPAGDPFHECRICHRTDHSDPTLEFRIADDGEEYCAEHQP